MDSRMLEDSEIQEVNKWKCDIRCQMPVGLFLAVCILCVGPVIIIKVVFPHSKIPQSVWQPVCSRYSEDDIRFQCMPNISHNNLTQDECEKWNCCWEFSGSTNRPKCYYPKNYGYLILNSTIQDDNCSINVLLTSEIYPSIYGEKYDNVLMKIICINDNILQVKFLPITSNKLFEPFLPTSFVHNISNNRSYVFVLKHEPFEILIKRKLNNAIIFQSSSDGMIFSDTFWQISAMLPSKNIYGLGQGDHSHLKHEMDGEKWVLFNSYPNSSKDTNFYGSHPFYLCLENDGNASGVLLWNSNAMEISLQNTPAITYRTLGGIFNFYFFLGNSPSDVVSQLTDIVGKPQMPPYWALGFHLCRAAKTFEELHESITSLKNMNIPQESECIDSKYITFSDPTYMNDLINFYHNLTTKKIHLVFRLSPFVLINSDFSDVAPDDIFVQNSNGNASRYLAECLYEGKIRRCYILDFSSNQTVHRIKSFFAKLNESINIKGFLLEENTPINYYNEKNNTCDNSNILNFPKYALKVSGGFLSYRTLCMDSIHFDNKPHYDIHNVYGHYHLKTTKNVFDQITNRNRPFLVSLSTFTGSGYYGGHWFPENKPSWDTLERALVQVLEFGLYGIPFVGSPSCGVRGDTSDDLCLRWIQLASFMPLALNYRSYGEIPQDPSTFSKKFISEAREALSTRYRILPYLYTSFYMSHKTGIPIVRPLFLDFPDAKYTFEIINQYMLGPAIMVSPTLKPNQLSKEIYLPPQSYWFDFYNGKLINHGDLFYRLEDSYYITHLHIRAGYIIPSQKPEITTTDARRNKFVLIVAPQWSEKDATAALGHIYIDDGLSVDSLTEDFIFVTITLYNNNSLFFDPLVKGTNSSSKLGKMIENEDVSTEVTSIRILDVNENPEVVFKNHSRINHVYSETTNAILLHDLNLNLKYKQSISWMFPNNSLEPFEQLSTDVPEKVTILSEVTTLHTTATNANVATEETTKSVPTSTDNQTSDDFNSDNTVKLLSNQTTSDFLSTVSNKYLTEPDKIISSDSITKYETFIWETKTDLINLNTSTLDNSINSTVPSTNTPIINTTSDITNTE